MTRRFLIIIMLTFSNAVAAGPELVESEIAALMGRLQHSDCEFNRNGTWYSGERASAHLTRKLNYLLSRGRLESAEQFIELGASASSFSGRPYLVRCQDQPTVRSRLWLLEQLNALRNP